MSYDVTIGDEYLNYTWNGNQIFYDHIRGPNGEKRGINTFNGRPAIEVLGLAADALDAIDQTRMNLWQEGQVGEPNLTAIYDPPNGWGSTIAAILFLGKIIRACVRNPTAIVEVC